ncbi:threonine/serine exporter family protein [Porphyromonadaceae bacterium W3.11]|nr:threonine/serine exporter family protein [Porphyromonadaceae bacterium W3.11]
MMSLTILVKAAFAGIASIGFAVLFNVPKRVLLSIFSIAFVSGIVKFIVLENNLSLIWSSLASGVCVGTLSVPFARLKFAPPLVIAIPSVIPMVPGTYIYRSIIGLISIATTNGPVSSELVTETIHNGMFSLFILAAISIGAGIPTIITRRQIMTAIEKEDSKSAR